MGGRAGSAADEGGVDERAFELRLPDAAAEDDEGAVGWNGRAMDDSFAPAPAPTPAFLPLLPLLFSSAESFFSASSSTGTVALGSMGSLSTRQFFTRSEIWLKMSIRP